MRDCNGIQKAQCMQANYDKLLSYLLSGCTNSFCVFQRLKFYQKEILKFRVDFQGYSCEPFYLYYHSSHHIRSNREMLLGYSPPS